MATRSLIKILIGIGFLMISLTLVSLVLGNDFLKPSLYLLHAAYLQMALAAAVLMAIALILFWHPGLLAAYLIAIGILFLPVSKEALKHQSELAGQNNPIRIATFSAMTRTRNGEDIHMFAAAQKPDILCLQEVLHEDVESLDALFPYAVSPPDYNLKIYSQLPITPLANSSTVQHADIELAEGSHIRVVNVHMPRQSHKDVKAYQKSWEKLMTAAKPEDPATQLLLCGDFNMTPYNRAYQKLLDNLAVVDTHLKGGAGLGLTFPHKQRRIAILGPQLRIDYLFARGFEVIDSQTLSASELSDHRAVVSTLALPSNPQAR